MQNRIKTLSADMWLSNLHPWRGHFNGSTFGVNVTVLTFTQANRGDGPTLHVHKYDEIFIVRRGQGIFKIGNVIIEAAEGDVLFGPANTPHAFKNIGDTPLETIDIHLSNKWLQEDLVDTDPNWWLRSLPAV
ncbi:cupin domain-containing protein [Gluconobacter japonicus]|uniref:Cupin domain-containing protein n=1 Tax=Gluconobacter japonicus TaxID=376620 RepID=A0A9Q2FMM2_GLUJA|nr:cupin domain-containing protein [Gluconobacter japonicus]MBF0871636.1 cupin domain-containing protein [Gluconobacter japonicus]